MCVLCIELFDELLKNHIKRKDCEEGRLFFMGNCNFSGFFYARIFAETERAGSDFDNL